MSQVNLLNGKLKVSGPIDFDSADRIYQEGLNTLKAVQNWPVIVDLTDVDHANTLLLAIILQWLKQCPDTNSIRIGEMPLKMKGILEASHLEHLKV